MLSGQDQLAESGWINDAADEPGSFLERLGRMAVRGQWTLSDLDWSLLDFSSLPKVFREAAADVFAPLQLGEKTAHLSAIRLLEFLPDGPARAFCETQVQDEARHADFFTRILDRLGCEGTVHPEVHGVMQEVREAETPEMLMAGMQILIESVAQSLFTEAGRLFSSLGAEQAASRGPMRSFRIVAGDWMSRLLARDESRHIAFGLYYLRERIPQLDPPARHRLEGQMLRWCEWVLREAQTPNLLNSVGVDGRAMCGQLLTDLNLRLAQIGLETRVGVLKTE